MNDTLANLLIRYGVTWYPKKMANFLTKNKVRVLPCDVGDKIYAHSSLLSKYDVNLEPNEGPTYLEGNVVSVFKNKDGWFLDIAIFTESIKTHLYKVDSVEFGKTLFNDSVSLDTYPDKDDQQCRVFQVPTGWLLKLLEKLDELNEQKGVNLENFLCNYCYEETSFIYTQARIKGLVLDERIVY